MLNYVLITFTAQLYIWLDNILSKWINYFCICKCWKSLFPSTTSPYSELFIKTLPMNCTWTKLTSLAIRIPLITTWYSEGSLIWSRLILGWWSISPHCNKNMMPIKQQQYILSNFLHWIKTTPPHTHNSNKQDNYTSIISYKATISNIKNNKKWKYFKSILLLIILYSFTNYSLIWIGLSFLLMKKPRLS